MGGLFVAIALIIMTFAVGGFNDQIAHRAKVNRTRRNWKELD